MVEKVQALVNLPSALSSSDVTEQPYEGKPSLTLSSIGSIDREKMSSFDEEKATGESVEASTPASSPAPTHLSGIKLIAVVSGLMLSVFLIVLDRTITATALPVIASHFRALEQAAWIATSYFLTQAGFLLAFGQALTLTRIKWTFLFAIFVFSLGSALCGAAWNFPTLLAGRAISGLGGSGISVSTLVVLAQVTKLEQRSMVLSSFAVVMALGYILGPLLGGVLTDHVSWRWCFYINLPVSAFTAMVLVLLVEDTPIPSGDGNEDINSLPLWKRLLRLDWLGNLLYLGLTVSLLLALEWGGSAFPWSDYRIIVLLVLTVVFSALFLAWEHRLGPKAVLPLHMFLRRNIAAVNVHVFLIMMMSMIGTYYLPIYYQVARSHTPTQAGIDVLPYMLCLIVGSTACGWFANRTGLVRPPMSIGPFLAAFISGFIFWVLRESYHQRTSTAMIVLQVTLGLSIGICMQQGIVVVQAEYRHEPKMIPQASAMVNATQMFGAVVGVAISGTMLNNKLLDLIPEFAPGLPAEQMKSVLQSAVAVRELESLWQPGVQRAYSQGLAFVFVIGIPGGVIATLASFLMPNTNLKK